MILIDLATLPPETAQAIKHGEYVQFVENGKPIAPPKILLSDILNDMPNRSYLGDGLAIQRAIRNNETLQAMNEIEQGIKFNSIDDLMNDLQGE